ncbi:EboA domain-containing protein [Streptomyces sp. NPDC059690]|uniref:EboA domain-containing protein n=1 Tax=Streptomyces sp. NPDC059690 TaxID=3346907 RepID=UPI0036B5A13C
MSTAERGLTSYTALSAALAPAAREWLEDAADRVRLVPDDVHVLFPAVGRHCGRGRLTGNVTVDEAARGVLLASLPLRGGAPAGVLDRLYRHGDTAERCAVLKALDLPHIGAGLDTAALPLIEDAIRTNDPRLLAAALGGYAAHHLAQPVFRQAVLKCAFTGVPLSGVAGLEERADGELARMLAAYAEERAVAGREVPQDVAHFLATRAAAPRARRSLTTERRP